VRVGTRVRVPFHGRRVGAWVVETNVEPPDGVSLLDLSKVSGYGPPPAVLALATWAAWRWAMPVATVLRTASPERNVWQLPVPPSASRSDSPVDAALPHAGPGTTLHRVPPTHDLLPLVLDTVGNADGPVLVLVPSTGWAERLTDRLRRRGVEVASSWAEAAAGWPVVVGSRAAAWAPVPRLGAAVVLDAHDYQDRYDATHVVAARAAADGAPCRLVTACPTAVQVATYGPAVTPPRAVERSGWAVLTVADRRGADPRTGLLSEELVQLARRVLPDRLVCVLNRTGRAKLLACVACGTLARCDQCGRAVEAVDDVLRCRGCGAERPSVCAACGSLRLKVLRQGVSRVREELAALLGTEVGEVSGETDALGVPETPVLIGTEAVLHRVRRAGAVAFLDFDQHLLAPRFAAGEQALALLARASRLVGPRNEPGAGTVMVQTRLPDHDVIRAAVAGDPGLATELDTRRALELPPFSALATVRSPEAPVLDGVEVSPLGGGRWLVRGKDHTALCDAVAVLHGGVRVDPDDV
jgi:primosomal protein N' (replication factor Y) (superfamily II helicase)